MSLVFAKMMKSGVSIIWLICVAAELARHKHSSYFKINTVCSVSLWASESCHLPYMELHLLL